MRDSRAETIEGSHTSGYRKMKISLQNYFFFSSGSKRLFLDNSWGIRKDCLKLSFDGIFSCLSMVLCHETKEQETLKRENAPSFGSFFFTVSHDLNLSE